jgi:hypothetical protein
MRINTNGTAPNNTPLTGAALLKNLRANGVLSRREVELLAALQDAAHALEQADRALAAREARRVINAFVARSAA